MTVERVVELAEQIAFASAQAVKQHCEGEALSMTSEEARKLKAEFVDAVKALANPGPRPMSEAPRDGTVILVFDKDQQWAYPISWMDGREPRWIYFPDEGHAIWEGDLLGWLPCPTYTGEAV